MKKNKLLQIWKQDKIAINSWLAIPNAWTAEILANTGFDACTIDMQHGLTDYTTAVSMLQAISTTETVPLVRVPWNEPILIMKMLDAGAFGIVAPMINNKAEAKTFIDSCMYPPVGLRSYGPVRAALKYGNDYFQHANEEVFPLAMIETKNGLENVEEIASVEGLKGFYIGTMDLSISLGIKELGDLHNTELMVAMKKIMDVANKYHLMVGVHSKSSEDTKILQNLGVNMITPINDSNLLQASAKRIYDETRNLLI